MNRKKFEQYKKILRILVALLLVTGATFFFILFWRNNYNAGIVFPFYYKGYWLVAAFYAFFFLLFIYIFGGMKYGYLKNTDVIFSQTLALLCANGAIYFQTVLLSAEFVEIQPMSEITLIQFLFIIIWSSIWDKIFRKLFPAHKVTVLYQEYDPTIFLYKIRERRDRYRIRKVVKMEEDSEKLKTLLNESEAVLLYDLSSDLRNEIVKYCYEHNIRTYVTPKVSDILLANAEKIHLFDTPLLLMRNNGMNIEDAVMKRMMDILISLIVIIVTSPLMLVIAIAIKCYDGGPVFFKQTRYTLQKRKFEIHKFRSMIVDAEKEGEVCPAVDQDPRITPVGKWIRMTRLDELPQVFDILKGDMSIVGPRPERVEHVEAYLKEIPEFSYRMKVKGGLTGYAQIYGKYNTSAYDKLKLDLMYIQNYSILLDVKLILMTIKVLFTKESTEGFHDEQISKIRKD